MKKHTVYTATIYILLLPLLFMAVACGRKACGAMPEDQRQLLARIEDSIGGRSPHARSMIERAVAEARDSMSRYECSVRMGRLFCISSTPDSMMPYVRQAIAFARRQPASSRRNVLLAYAYNCLGVHYHNFHQSPDTVINCYRMADSLLAASDMQEQRPMVCANLGDAYMFGSRLVEAAGWYRRALFLADSLRLPESDNATLYMGLATIYQQLNDYRSSLQYFQLAERHFDTMSVPMKAYFLNNFGNYYYYTRDYRTALGKFLALQWLLEEKHMDRNFDMYLCRLNMADLYLNLDSLDLSAHCLDEVEPFMRCNGDMACVYYCNTIRIGLAVKHGDMAQVRRIVEGEPAAYGQTVPFNMRQVRNTYLQRYYEAVGDYRRALYTLREDMAENDSLEHNRTNMRTSEVMERFAQDTLKLHHSLDIEQKNVDIQHAHAMTMAAVALVLAVALVFALYWVRVRRRNMQTRMRIMQLRLSSARNRISPHFVFNVLNNKLLNADSKEANELLELTKLIRANLDMSCKDTVTLSEELDFVHRYVEVERHLVDGGLDFRVEVEDGVDCNQVSVPSMFVQILVENAFVHGLRGWEGPKRLCIQVQRRDKGILVTVTDNGPGFDIRSVGQKKRTGLNIITQTISAVNERSKDKMKFHMRNIIGADGKNAGCEASIYLPLV